MNKRPILFSAPMVRALLNGSKTQTRRVVKPQHLKFFDQSAVDMLGAWDKRPLPYGQPGDRLWVRETWWHDEEDNSIIYRVDANSDIVDVNKHETGLAKYNWRPSIFMPRAASRITLEITAVRVERLQDISEADALAEGVTAKKTPDACYTAREAYAVLWESINDPGSWDLNPWVWVIEFKKVTA